jgi:hypothetical protein
MTSYSNSAVAARHDPDRAHLVSGLSAVQKWVEARGYKGYDPGDGLTSFLRPLTFGSVFAERVLQQAIWKSPWNIRPLVGVKPLDSTKGRGFMAWGYLLLFKATGDQTFRDQAFACLDWLRAHKTHTSPFFCWGNHFDFSSRSGRIPAHQPTIVWTGLIGQAFLEAYEQTGEARFLEVAGSICDWILQLPRENTSQGYCISYVPFTQFSIHNSNLLGAAMLARTWWHLNKPEYLAAARESALYTCSRMREDGSWWYGEHPKYHWVDNFHTAYNLDSLKRYIDATGDDSFVPCLKRGYRYFVDTFFEESGRPRYYHNNTFPVDIQCASQAIDTLAFFADEFPEGIPLAEKVAKWTMDNMQDRSGYFYYRQYPMLTSKTPYFHWGQATMFKALAHLALKTKVFSQAPVLA